MSQTKKIVLYDGVCNLCDFTVRFILPRDPKGKFSFASLQGEFAKETAKADPLVRSAIGTHSPETLILIEDGRIYERSSAVLRIVSQLQFPWNLLGVLRIIPGPIRDAIYRWIARNRYRWFGKQDTCLLPSPEWKSRFLD